MERTLISRAVSAIKWPKVTEEKTEARPVLRRDFLHVFYLAGVPPGLRLAEDRHLAVEGWRSLGDATRWILDPAPYRLRYEARIAQEDWVFETDMARLLRSELAACDLEAAASYLKVWLKYVPKRG